MNHTTRRTLCLSLMFLVGAGLFLGCGPENLDDPAYLAQLSESGIINDAADKDAAPMKMPSMMDTTRDAQDKVRGLQRPGMGGPGMRMPGAPGVAGQPGIAADGPVGAVAAPAVAAVPVPVVQAPGAVTVAPTIYEELPPVVTHTAEAHQVERDILHIQNVVRNTPMVEEHVVATNHHTRHLLQTNIINQSSFIRNVSFAPTATESVEVLPTTEVVLPTVDLGFIPRPIVPVPGCAPWLGGGFHRFCGGVGPGLLR